MVKLNHCGFFSFLNGKAKTVYCLKYIEILKDFKTSSVEFNYKKVDIPIILLACQDILHVLGVQAREHFS